MELWLLTVGTLIAVLVLQTSLLLLTRKHCRPLRFALLGLLACPVYGMVDAWQTGGFLWELGVLLWAIIALCGLIGWAVAWAIHMRLR